MCKHLNNKRKTALLTLLTAGGFIGATGSILYDYTINRKRKFLFGPNLTKEDTLTYGDFLRTDIAEKTLDWAENTQIRQHKATAFDGIELSAYSFEQKKPSKKWLIAVHGYGKSASSMFPIAHPFYEAGFNVLLPECRGTGHSGGNCLGLGWLDRQDVVKWVFSILNDCPDAQIALYGISTGADAVLMASGEELPANVRCIISDSAYANLVDEYNYLLRKTKINSVLVAGFMTFSTSLITSFRAGYSFKNASALQQVARSKIPTLFIHGGSDTLVPTEMVYLLYNVAACPKELLVVPQATHGYSLFADYSEYWKRIWKFTQPYIPTSESEKPYIDRLVDQINRIRGRA